MHRWKKRIFCILFLTVFLLDFSLLIFDVSARKQKDVSGFSKQDTLQQGESVSYRFSNNIKLKISSDAYTELDIEYSENIENREFSIDIESGRYRYEHIYLEIQSERSMRSFGISEVPNDPKNGEIPLRTQYRCIYRIKSNHTIEKLKFEFGKTGQHGIDPLIEYSVAVYEEDEDSWDLIDTEEKVEGSDSEVYLKADIDDIEPNTDYYITLYEVSYWSYVWIGIIIIAAIGFLSLVIIISKSDYFHYLKTRTASIEKGAHRLTIDEVLENENRNKIIDLILEMPGIHFNELLRKTELAAGNLVWHLDILETYKVIGKKRISNFIVYFPYHQKNPISNVDLKLSKSRLTLEVLEMIENEPGVWGNLITKRIKVDHKTIHYHVKKLLELGLIDIKKEGRKKKLFPNLDSEYFLNKNNNPKSYD